LRTRAHFVCFAAAALLLDGRLCMATGPGPADLVVTDARIYTARPQREMAEALAVQLLEHVIPFIQPVHGNSYAALHPPGSYYESNAYPFRSSKEAGSIEVGKSGDFIVLDQDILRLADEGRADDIRTTEVLEAWFMGKPVHVRKGGKANA